MSYQLVYSTVRESLRRAIYVVRVQNAALARISHTDWRIGAANQRK
jgi:hypothetical protein